MNWITVALLLLVVALVFRLGLLVYAMYTLLAVLLVSRWLARQWSEHVTAERVCDQLAADVGDTVRVVIRLRNTGRLPIPWMLIEDLLPRHALLHDPPNLQVRGRRVLLTMLGRHAEREISYQLVCNRRGYYQLGPLVLETGDLFGLHRRYRMLTHPHFLLVYPRVVSIPGYDIASKRPVGEVRMAHRLYEDPTRIAGVRQYQPGDPLHRVHWRATARTGVLHSKIYEPSSVAGATLLLDFHTADYAPRFEPFRSETAITLTASLASTLYELGQQCGLITNGRDAADRIRHEGWANDQRTRAAARSAGSMLARSERLRPLLVPTRRGPEQLRRILENLARLELTDGLRFHELIGETRSDLPRDATVIAILSQIDESGAVALGSLVREGYAVTALVNVYDTYEYAAAAGLLMSQGVAVRQLRDEASIVSLCQAAVLR